jgi:hypothetical protein
MVVNEKRNLETGHRCCKVGGKELSMDLKERIERTDVLYAIHPFNPLQKPIGGAAVSFCRATLQPSPRNAEDAELY